MAQKSKVFVLTTVLLLTILVLGLASPVQAFDGKNGESVLIPANDTINDNLYVGAQTFILDGTVNGDVLAAGDTITINGKVNGNVLAGGATTTINGKVNGDVMAAGQTVIINGEVSGDVRMAGGALFIGEKANITGEVIALGGSLETRKGSQIGQDLVLYGGQALLAGNIKRNVKAGTGGLQIDGEIGGNVEAEVGDSSNSGPNPSVYLTNVSVALPVVPTGLTISPSSRIGGKLVYTSSKEISLPAEVVAGGTQHLQPVINPKDIVKTPTLSEQIMIGIFNALRRMVTLILLGLFLGWLFPALLKDATNNVRQAALPMMGWGIVSWAAFFFAVLVLIIATSVGAIVFGALTLTSISGAIVWLGILALFTLSLGFMLASAHIAQIIVSILGGKLILARIKPEWSEHKTWPLVIGVVIFAIISALPYFGWLINLLAILMGLGALWTLGKNLLVKQQASAAAAV